MKTRPPKELKDVPYPFSWTQEDLDDTIDMLLRTASKQDYGKHPGFSWRRSQRVIYENSAAELEWREKYGIWGDQQPPKPEPKPKPKQVTRRLSGFLTVNIPNPEPWW
jgi:hypothetical protein